HLTRTDAPMIFPTEAWTSGEARVISGQNWMLERYMSSLKEGTATNQNRFYVYLDQDSGFNHFAGLAGINIDEPQNWGVLQTRNGYDLGGADSITFDVRSPSTSTAEWLSLPLSTQTFGVVGQTAAPFALDEVNRNSEPIYESALMIAALSGSGGDGNRA